MPSAKTEINGQPAMMIGASCDLTVLHQMAPSFYIAALHRQAASACGLEFRPVAAIGSQAVSSLKIAA
jgi:hypothetical protein